MSEAVAELRSAVAAYVARRVSPDAADDVVQDVFLRLSRGEGEGRARDLRAFVFTVARNAVADHHRHASRDARAREALADEARTTEPVAAVPLGEVDDGRAERLLAAWLGHAIEGLPEPYRETLRLTELERRPHAEVALALGVARGTVKARVSRGRALLRAALDACCEVELDARRRVVDLRPREGCCAKPRPVEPLTDCPLAGDTGTGCAS